jgi:hypothetical protein
VRRRGGNASMQPSAGRLLFYIGATADFGLHFMRTAMAVRATISMPIETTPAMNNRSQRSITGRILTGPLIFYYKCQVCG